MKLKECYLIFNHYFPGIQIRYPKLLKQVQNMKFEKYETGHYTAQTINKNAEYTIDVFKTGSTWQVFASITKHDGSFAYKTRSLVDIKTLKAGKIAGLGLLQELIKELIKEILKAKKEQPKPLYKANSRSIGTDYIKPILKPGIDLPGNFLGSKYAVIKHIYKAGKQVICKPGYHYRINKSTSSNYRKMYNLNLNDFPKHENVLVVDNKTGKIAGYVRV